MTQTNQSAGGRQNDRQAVAKSNLDTLRSMLGKMESQLRNALPRFLTPERMIRVATTTVQRVPKLLECDPITVVGAIMQAAQLGLEPDNVTGTAYMVPFWNSKQRRMECTLIPGYRGLMMLARRSKDIQAFDARVVKAGDLFAFEYGSRQFLTHKPAAAMALQNGGKDNGGAVYKFDPKAPEPETIAAYMIAFYGSNGLSQFQVMFRPELERVKEMTKSRNREGQIVGPWIEHPDAMFTKTVIRRGAKLLPFSIELQTAVSLDERAAAGRSQNLGLLVADSLGIDFTPAPEDDDEQTHGEPGTGDVVSDPARDSEVAALFSKLGYNDARQTTKLQEFRGRPADLLEYLRSEAAKPIAEATTKPAAQDPATPANSGGTDAAAKPEKDTTKPAKKNTAAKFKI